MGRKGVSKRKPSQTKTKPLSTKNASGRLSSVVQAAESQPVKSFDTGKAVPSTKGGGKNSSDSKKNTKKGKPSD
jgi:hypothetical protein